MCAIVKGLTVSKTLHAQSPDQPQNSVHEDKANIGQVPQVNPINSNNPAGCNHSTCLNNAADGTVLCHAENEIMRSSFQAYGAESCNAVLGCLLMPEGPCISNVSPVGARAG